MFFITFSFASKTPSPNLESEKSVPKSRIGTQALEVRDIPAEDGPDMYNCYDPHTYTLQFAHLRTKKEDV